ncbi:MAG: PAS domain-containing protein [Gammaproteobacteria bacterium]|jgi:PAS domain S-box-containing protein|nr:PAS domain-containing protein [Gammaproteobacteria bacterium]
MTQPLRLFLLISIVSVTLTVASLLYLHVRLTEGYIDIHLDSHNKNLAVVLRNSILKTGLEQELLDGSHVLTSTTLTSIRTKLERELRWIPVIKVKIYSRDGRVLFSTKSDEIGEDASDNKGYLSAMDGIPASGKVDPDDLNEFDKVVEIQNLHQQYVPILSINGDGPIGVFETYLDIHEIIKNVEAMQQTMFWMMGSLLAAIYLAITATFLRTHGLLRNETRLREMHLNELRGMQANLEKRVEERTAELDHAKSFLQSVIDGIANPLFVIRPDFTVALMNQKARSLIRPGLDERDYRYCYQVSHNLQTPCSQPEHPCPFMEVRQKGTAVSVKHRHQDQEGNEVILELLTTPLYSVDGQFEGVIEVQHDVTELVEIQNELIGSQARLQATMDNVPDAILTCDNDFVILSANQSALGLLNQTESQLVGRRLGDFFPDDDNGSVLALESPAHQQTVLKPVSDMEFPVDLWKGPLENTGGDSSYIVVIRDITEQIKAQRDLENTRQQNFHQEKMAAIGELAAGILHEVGNPIAAIAGATAEVKSATRDISENDYVTQNIELIDEQITRLGKITREIADFTSPKPREREMLDLNELLKSTARLLTYDRRFGSVGVRLQLDKNLPAIVGVADQLTQVFMNLLINAMHACAPDETNNDAIILTSETGSDGVHVCVQDFGSGMSTETIEHVRETFYTTKPVGEGTGLGLSLCDTIVSAHGGELRIESEEGKGTRVHVFLPLDLAGEVPPGDKPNENRRAM